MYNWLFSHNEGDSARYILANLGLNNLICIGINPSTAVPNNLDNTLKKVQNIAQLNGFDGWAMLNVYPQRDTHPENLHPELERELILANQDAIRILLRSGNFTTVWAAWGDDISRRPYLINCLNGIRNCFEDHFNWVHYGNLTVNGNPRHPSRVSYHENFTAFDINEYLANNG